MTEQGSGQLRQGIVLAWSEAARSNENFKSYTALVGSGPFSDYEITAVSAKPPVYGDERFRDGMRVPEKLISAEAKQNEARQVGDTQRVKLHVIDAEGHHVSAEFPGYFFTPAP